MEVIRRVDYLSIVNRGLYWYSVLRSALFLVSAEGRNSLLTVKQICQIHAEPGHFLLLPKCFTNNILSYLFCKSSLLALYVQKDKDNSLTF